MTWAAIGVDNQYEKKMRNQCEKDEWYSEAFGFSPALRVITISLSAMYHTYMIT